MLVGVVCDKEDALWVISHFHRTGMSIAKLHNCKALEVSVQYAYTTVASVRRLSVF